MNLIKKARDFAIAAHGDQLRKWTGAPYWHHLENVAKLVSSVDLDERVIAAAWLHDTLEDTKTTQAALLAEFGELVTDLVLQLTDQAPKSLGNRAARKAWECARLATVSARAKTIKLADLIDNTPSIVEHDPAFAVVYVAEKKALLQALQGGDRMLHRQAQATLRVSERILAVRAEGGEG